jgi:hypothetical protein
VPDYWKREYEKTKDLWQQALRDNKEIKTRLVIANETIDGCVSREGKQKIEHETAIGRLQRDVQRYFSESAEKDKQLQEVSTALKIKNDKITTQASEIESLKKLVQERDRQLHNVGVSLATCQQQLHEATKERDQVRTQLSKITSPAVSKPLVVSSWFSSTADVSDTDLRANPILKPRKEFRPEDLEWTRRPECGFDISSSLSSEYYAQLSSQRKKDIFRESSEMAAKSSTSILDQSRSTFTNLLSSNRLTTERKTLSPAKTFDSEKDVFITREDTWEPPAASRRARDPFTACEDTWESPAASHRTEGSRSTYFEHPEKDVSKNLTREEKLKQASKDALAILGIYE